MLSDKDYIYVCSCWTVSIFEAKRVSINSVIVASGQYQNIFKHLDCKVMSNVLRTGILGGRGVTGHLLSNPVLAKEVKITKLFLEQLIPG